MGDLCEIGDTWACECGACYVLEGGYLAAHWSIELVHKCPHCLRKHFIWNGCVELIEEDE